MSADPISGFHFIFNVFLYFDALYTHKHIP